MSLQSIQIPLSLPHKLHKFCLALHYCILILRYYIIFSLYNCVTAQQCHTLVAHCSFIVMYAKNYKKCNTSITSLHRSVLLDNNGALWASPALLIQMSAPPNCDFIALIIDKMSSSLLTSHFMATSLPSAGLSSWDNVWKGLGLNIVTWCNDLPQ